jgi:DNA-binding CsgD family transcriptional regulator
LVYIVAIPRDLRRYSVERLSSYDLESLISRLRETIYAYCDVRGFKTRLVSALLGHGSPVMKERASMLSHQRLERLGLTRREVEILYLVTQGKTNKEIAAALYISPLTVRTHLEHIYQKLGVGSRTEAAAIVLSFPELSGSVPG